jgi:membrane protease YdiL (CAAX protease family)
MNAPEEFFIYRGIRLPYKEQMMDTQLNTKRTRIFLAIAFGIPWAAALAFYLSGMLDTNPGQAVMLVNYVFISTPALANIATRLITREGWKRLWLRPNFKRGWKFYLAAWLLPLLAVMVGSLAFYLFFPQSYDPNFTRARGQISIFTSASVADPWMVMLALMLEKMIFQGLIISVLAIGEEFGWRAYLLQKITDRFGSARNAAVLVGLIWAAWHMPLLFMGLGTDPNISGFREILLFALIYPISTISTSILLSWVTLRSGSVWPAAIGHATELVVASLAMGMLKGPINLLVSPNSQSLIGNLGCIVLALVLYFNRKAFARTALAGEKETHSEQAPAVARAQ